MRESFKEKQSEMGRDCYLRMEKGIKQERGYMYTYG